MFHFGVQGKSDAREDLHPIRGFSGLPTSEGEGSHRMTDAEIEQVIEVFVLAARTATENGMDGVELHGTHGELIQQSFSTDANNREDEWGSGLNCARTVASRSALEACREGDRAGRTV